MESHPTVNWPQAPSWAVNLGQAGQALIIGAATAFILATLFSFLGGKSHSFRRFSRLGLYTGSAGLFSAFAVLATLLLTRQYSFDYVFTHTDNALPDEMYRFSALWGGQEGSFLLWGCTSALFALLALKATKEYERLFTAFSALFLGSISGILAYESPFKLLDFAAMLGKDPGKILLPPDGNGLTPALLNYWMKIHPPTIFLGFGSLIVLFAWSMAALWSGNLESWLKPVKPWVIITSTLTGIGLVMGGFWAYETLGWGGFWMWDPVENASLVPWLLSTALIHQLFVATNRGKWLISTAFIGGLAFIGFLYGTFLTRSGFLGDTSVHSFAQMDRGALWILTGVLVGALLGLSAGAIRQAILRRGIAPKGELDSVSPLNLNQAYGWAVALLTAVAVASAIGMSVPLIQSLRGQQPSVVEEPLYNRVMAYLYLPTILLMGIAPFLSWRGVPFKKLMGKLSNIIGLSLGFVGIGMMMMWFIPKGMEVPATTQTNFGWAKVPTVPWVLFLSFVTLFAILANIWRLAENWKILKTRSGSFLTHVGVALCVLGLILSRGLQRKEQFDVQQGRPGVALGYLVTLENTGRYDERENRVSFRFNGRGEDFLAKPILFYTNRSGQEPQPTVRPWIKHSWLHDKYVTVYPLVSEATEPFTMKPGQSLRYENTVYTYEKLVTTGTPGTQGASFGAHFVVSDPVQGQLHVTPKMELGEQGIVYQPAQIFEDFFLYMTKMDAADKSVEMQLHYVRPILPMELYYKPLPGLIWLGAGIMTFGGFLAAWQRRRTIKSPSKESSFGDSSPKDVQTPTAEIENSPR